MSVAADVECPTWVISGHSTHPFLFFIAKSFFNYMHDRQLGIFLQETCGLQLFEISFECLGFETLGVMLPMVITAEPD